MQRRAVITTAAILAVLVFLIAVPGTSFYTDLLWFRDAGYPAVFTRQVGTQTMLFVAAGALFILIAGANVFLARKLTPLRPLAITNDFLFNLRRSLDPVIRWVQVGVIGVVAFAFASATLPIWQKWLLFNHSQSFGIKDPVFSHDIGFYVFELPIWRFAAGWLLWALILATLMVAAVYAYAGAIGPQPEGGYLAPQPRVHLSVLLGFLLLLKAGMYLMDQWDQLFAPGGPGGFVQGAKYTQVNAQIPAYRVLFFIAIGCAILMFATFATKRLVLPVTAIALMAISALILGGLFPVLMQTFKVQPNANSLQKPYVERGITATRQAFGLDKVERRPFSAQNTLTPEDLLRNIPPLRNVRIWDDAQLLDNVRQTQSIAPYYNFTSVPGVDRYPIGDQTQQVLVNARNVEPSQLSEDKRTWQNVHLVYTHGLGAVVAQSNETTQTGDPSLLVQDIPPRNASGAPSLNISEPRLYFADNSANVVLQAFDAPAPDVGDDFVIVGTTVPEADGPPSGDVKEYRYSGTSGIKLDSFVRRLAFAIRFGDSKFILSSAITPKSRLMYARDVRSRLQRLAPFLTFDSSPYLTIVGGRMVWIADAYTTTANYPYSQQLDAGADPALEALDGTAYIRNSVKVTLDAFSGEATFYQVDMNDPIATAWSKVFPKEFKRADAVPPEVRRHFRTPLDMFNAQLQTWAQYHADAETFIEGTQTWSVAQQPGQSGRNSAGQEIKQTVPLRSQYYQTVLPGSTNSEFVLFNSMTPKGKTNLASMLFARSDPENFGQLVQYDLPDTPPVAAPEQVYSVIASDPVLSQKQSLLSTGNSRLEFGQIRIVPINQSLLYVQPWYVSANASSPRPQIKLIALVYGTRVTSGATFSEALLAMFGVTPLNQAAPTGEATARPTVPTGGGGTPAAPSLQQIADEAQTVYGQMQDALKAGDLAKYGELEKRLGALISDLQNAAKTAPTTTAPPP